MYSVSPKISASLCLIHCKFSRTEHGVVPKPVFFKSTIGDRKSKEEFVPGESQEWNLTLDPRICCKEPKQTEGEEIRPGSTAL